MEIRDWVTIISVFLVITGWFVNSYLNRKSEIAKRRLDHRLPTLKSFIKMWYYVQEHPQDRYQLNEYKKLLVDVREDFQLYGKLDEIKLFESFMEYETGESRDSKKAKNDFEKLVELVRKRIRDELDIH